MVLLNYLECQNGRQTCRYFASESTLSRAQGKQQGEKSNANNGITVENIKKQILSLYTYVSLYKYILITCLKY